MKKLAIVGLILSIALAAQSPLLAQPGREKERIIGLYDWHNGNVVVIRADGTATSGERQGGRWVKNLYGGSGYVIMWEGGYVESLKLKERGDRLEGTGLDSDGNAYPVWGNRRK
jgi:hypothetical protein